MKQHNKISKGGVFILGVLCLAFMAPVFAGKDDLYVKQVNSLTVNSSSATFSNTINPANIRTIAITDPIVGAKPVSIEVVWGIAAGSGKRSTMWPNDGVTFSGDTTSGTSVGAIAISPASCDFSNDTITCVSTISFTPQNVDDSAIELTIVAQPPSKSPSNKELQPRNLKIDLSVIQQVAKKDTTLTVKDPQCFTYGAGDVNLEATLTEKVSTLPISGATVGFTLESDPIGTTITEPDGKALLPYNINSLSGGDYDLFAAFDGDSTYNPSGGSGTVGIMYNFIGFQQPINADGTSIISGGRVLPIKIKIVDNNLQPITDAAPTVWVTQVSPLTALGSDLEAASSVSAADTGNTMRYDPTAGQYIYNWDAMSLTNGTWYVIVELGDSKACSTGPHYVTITVNKKKTK